MVEAFGRGAVVALAILSCALLMPGAFADAGVHSSCVDVSTGDKGPQVDVQTYPDGCPPSFVIPVDGGCVVVAQRGGTFMAEGSYGCVNALLPNVVFTSTPHLIHSTGDVCTPNDTACCQGNSIPCTAGQIAQGVLDEVQGHVGAPLGDGGFCFMFNATWHPPYTFDSEHTCDDPGSDSQELPVFSVTLVP